MKYIETIKIIDAELQNMQYHSQRMLNTTGVFFDLENIVPPVTLQKGIVKCRILYDNYGITEITFSPYSLPKIKTLKIIECNEIDYSYKFSDRTCINTLFASRENCDDILIIKNGMITDTSFCNVVFEKDGALFTPSSPLLQGTKRKQLIKDGKISELTIRLDNILDYDRIHLINAMIDLYEVVLVYDNR